MWTLLSILLSVFAIGFTYYAWKNPIDASFNPKMFIEDGETIYKIGFEKSKWKVLKIEVNKVVSGKEYTQIADTSNNPSQKSVPKDLETVKSLEFRA